MIYLRSAVVWHHFGFGKPEGSLGKTGKNANRPLPIRSPMGDFPDNIGHSRRANQAR